MSLLSYDQNAQEDRLGVEHSFPVLFHVLEEEDAMRWDLLEVGLSFFCALYGQKQGTPMEDASYNLYTKTKARPRLRNLPPNSANLLLHVQRAHLQMTLGKAADQHSPPDIDISNFGWEIKAGVLSPCSLTLSWT